MVQIGVAGKNIGLSQVHGPSAGLGVDVPAGILVLGGIGEQLFELSAEVKSSAKAAEGISCLIQGLNGESQAGIETFQDFL